MTKFKINEQRRSELAHEMYEYLRENRVGLLCDDDHLWDLSVSLTDVVASEGFVSFDGMDKVPFVSFLNLWMGFEDTDLDDVVVDVGLEGDERGIGQTRVDREAFSGLLEKYLGEGVSNDE